MKKFLEQLADLITNLFNENSILLDIKNRQNKLDDHLGAVEAKLDHVLLNQELLNAYLGLTPGGATAEDLDTLGAKLQKLKERIAQFDQSTTQS
jgi:hypothetical protein